MIKSMKVTVQTPWHQQGDFKTPHVLRRRKELKGKTEFEPRHMKQDSKINMKTLVF